MVMEEAMDSEMSLSNMVLGFFEEAERERSWPENDDDDEGSSGGGAAEIKAFWQTQHSQLHEALAKTSPAESRIRADTEEAIKTMRAAGAVCSCARRAAAGDCRSCMLRHVAERLSGAGYNSAICKSKWTRSPDIPSVEQFKQLPEEDLVLISSCASNALNNMRMRRRGGSSSSIRCYECDKLGHIKMDCPRLKRKVIKEDKNYCLGHLRTTPRVEVSVGSLLKRSYQLLSILI